MNTQSEGVADELKKRDTIRINVNMPSDLIKLVRKTEVTTKSSLSGMQVML